MAVLQVAWGGGVNSTAMLVGMWEREIRPDAILFADTGGEKPDTYAFVHRVRAWLLRVGFPALVTVRKESPLYATLEEECLKAATLPSRAFGFGKCAQKWKHAPQDKWMNAWPPALEVWNSGEKVTKAIGYHADEVGRASITENEKYRFWHPLIEWDWGQEECVAAIRRAGLPVPPKSACFYCPSSTKREVLRLNKQHPDLMARALAMEEAAQPNLVNIKGLGRHWAWGDLVAADEAQQKLFPEAPVESCMMCSDGEPDTEAA